MCAEWDIHTVAYDLKKEEEEEEEVEVEKKHINWKCKLQWDVCSW